MNPISTPIQKEKKIIKETICTKGNKHKFEVIERDNGIRDWFSIDENCPCYFVQE